jgi:hypothetical protein
MAQNASELEREIAEQREALEAHVHQLEAKIGKMTDWRESMRQRPLAITAGAFSAGLILAFLFVRSR